MAKMFAIACLLAATVACASAQGPLTPMEAANSPNIGTAPAGSPAGCNSPYAVLLNAPNAQQFGAALAQSDLETHFKFRNMSGNILVPTDMAFMNFARQNNLVLGQVDDSILKSIILYHTLFQTLSPTDLMRLTTTGMPYQTALVFNSNDAVPMNRSTMTTAELFAYSPMQMYQNVTVQNQGMGSTHQFVANGAATMANIFTSDPYTPIRTCQGYVYRVDNVLLPTSTITALSSSAAPAPSSAAAGK